MSQTVSIITPAYKAQSTLTTTVRSVIEQTHADWQHWIVADDGFDYGTFLHEQGLNDPRQVFLTSGGVGRGASLKPGKLEQAIAKLDRHGIVTTALDVMSADFRHLRHVGVGPDRVLSPGEHKWVNLSMDAMVVWDRRRGDGRFDPDMSNMTDLEFLLQLYSTNPQSYHLGTPLHDYIKRDGSMSNARDVTAGMIASKREITARLEAGRYGLSEADVAGLIGFLNISIMAEAAYGAATTLQPGLLFEDHIEPMLSAPAS
jgi:glycosyltransferase involved in cell wall biosynthesis